MKHSFKRIKIFTYFILITVLLLIQNYNDVYGLDYYERICNLNSDPLLDTIVVDSNYNFSHIKWGSVLPQGFQVTYFVFPKENLEKCKFSLINFDQDSLQDIYINIKYSYYNIDSIFVGMDSTVTGMDSIFVSDSTFTGIDSTFHYIIFGQESIINIDTVYLNSNSVLPVIVESYTGIDEIFDDIALCTPGSMKVMTFKQVERVPPVPKAPVSSVNDMTSSKQLFEIFPVPSSDFINFKLSGFENGNYNLEVYNLFNQQVYQQRIQITSPIYNGNVNLFGFSSGIYSVRISNAATNLHKLIIIVK